MRSLLFLSKIFRDTLFTTNARIFYFQITGSVFYLPQRESQVSFFNWYIYVMLKVHVGTTNYTMCCAEYVILSYSYTHFLTPT